jgi:hypothetical protein
MRVRSKNQGPRRRPFSSAGTSVQAAGRPVLPCPHTPRLRRSLPAELEPFPLHTLVLRIAPPRIPKVHIPKVHIPKVHISKVQATVQAHHHSCPRGLVCSQPLRPSLSAKCAGKPADLPAKECAAIVTLYLR